MRLIGFLLLLLTVPCAWAPPDLSKDLLEKLQHVSTVTPELSSHIQKVMPLILQENPDHEVLKKLIPILLGFNSLSLQKTIVSALLRGMETAPTSSRFTAYWQTLVLTPQLVKSLPEEKCGELLFDYLTRFGAVSKDGSFAHLLGQLNSRIPENAFGEHVNAPQGLRQLLRVFIERPPTGKFVDELLMALRAEKDLKPHEVFDSVRTSGTGVSHALIQEIEDAIIAMVESHPEIIPQIKNKQRIMDIRKAIQTNAGSVHRPFRLEDFKKQIASCRARLGRLASPEFHH